MTWLIAICVLKNWKGQERLERLRIGMTRNFEGFAQFIRYFAWNVWERSVIREWLIGRGRSLGSIGGGGMSKVNFQRIKILIYENS
jgi:hypothetical protein